MDETVNTPFHKDEDITELMEMLKSFKDKDGLSKLYEAVGFVESLENVLDGISLELTNLELVLLAVKQQNAYLVKQSERTMKDDIMAQVHEAMDKVSDLWDKVRDIRADIKRKAHEIVEDVKQSGRKALKKLTEIFHIREGLNRVKDKADKMLSDLDSLSAKVEEYTEKEHHEVQERTTYGEEPDIAGVKTGEPEHKAEPVGTYQQEMQRFLDNCVAEGKEYGSNAEAYEAFKNYYDKRMKAQGQSGTQMSHARTTDKKSR